MYKIAVCDDEIIMLDHIYDKIISIIDEHRETYEICKFNSGEAILDAIISKETYFDVIFLDIEMGKISGLEVANKITSITDKINIVFVTNRDDLVFDAINFRPFSFIRKSRLNVELELVIKRLKQKLKKENAFCEIEIDKKKLKIRLKDIIYIESQGHYILIKCIDKDYKIRGKIFDFEIELIEFGFIRIHIAYLVNLSHICFVKYNGICLDNDAVLPISRKKFEETKNKHLEYVRKCIHGINWSNS